MGEGFTFETVSPNVIANLFALLSLLTRLLHVSPARSSTTNQAAQTPHHFPERRTPCCPLATRTPLELVTHPKSPRISRLERSFSGRSCSSFSISVISVSIS